MAAVPFRAGTDTQYNGGGTFQAGQMQPVEVMAMLNDLYSHFDKLVTKHGVYKVLRYPSTLCYAVSVPGTDIDCTATLFNSVPGTNMAYTATLCYAVSGTDIGDHARCRSGRNDRGCLHGRGWRSPNPLFSDPRFA
eukprot:2241469-Rhodomonas_salina.2